MSRLNKILADFPILKTAVENPDRAQHEKDFSQLAFAFLQDRAAGLLPYLLGFEVVDRDEDGSKAVGIFGFNVSGHYYYVPAFFINSQIKGMDLLFSKTTNNFMPLQEEWINKIINKSGVRLGKAVDSDQVQQDFESPNLTNMIEPPVMAGKTASVRPTADLSAHLSHNAWNVMQKTAADAVMKDKAFREAFAGAIAAMQGESLEKTAGSAIISFLENAGGPKAVESFMRSMQNIKYANAFFEFYKDLAPFHVTKYAEELAPIEVKPDLRVTDDVKDVNAEIKDTDSNSREKARLITDGFAILDNRKPETKSTVYSQDLSGLFAAPDEAGIYDILTNSGTFKEVAAIPLFEKHYNGSFIFVDLKDKVRCYGEPEEAIASRKFDKDIEDIAKPLSSINAPAEGVPLKPEYGSNYDKNVYFIYSPSDKAGFVASIDRRTSGEGGHRFSLWHCDGLPRNSASKGKGFSSSEVFDSCSSDLVCEGSCCGPAPRFLQISNLDGKKLSWHGDTIVIPRSFKAIKLEGVDGSSFLGSVSTLDSALFDSGFSRLDVDFDGTDYSVRVNGEFDTRLSKKEACVKLVEECGLSVPDMDELVARAEAGSSKPVIVKIAQFVGVNMPMPVPPGPGADPYTGMGIPMEEPFIQNQPGSFSGIPSLQDPTQPGFADGGQSTMESGGGGAPGAGALPDDVMQLADQAAQSGQKHVFDQSTIAGLAGLYDIGYAIDMYIPELTKSLDRIGRILFIFYWKNDEFAERYGEQDLAGMEDLLRNVFKSFGSLVLRLQEKSIEGLKEVN